MEDVLRTLKSTLHHVVDTAFTRDEETRRAFIHDWIDTYCNRAAAVYQSRVRAMSGEPDDRGRNPASELSGLQPEEGRAPTADIYIMDDPINEPSEDTRRNIAEWWERYGYRRATGESVPSPRRHPGTEADLDGLAHRGEGTGEGEHRQFERVDFDNLRRSVLDAGAASTDTGRSGGMSSNYPSRAEPLVPPRRRDDGSFANPFLDGPAYANEGEGPTPTDWTAGMAGVRRRAIDANGNQWEERRILRCDNGRWNYWWQLVDQHISDRQWPANLASYSPRLIDSEPWPS